MIRHDILRNPDEVIRTFDFGNDFRDTQCWLQGSQDTLDVLRSLETAHRNYMDQNYRREARETPAGRLLVRYGFEPYDTESSARRVAERADGRTTTHVATGFFLDYTLTSKRNC